jgi:hypothetical protein
LDPLPDTSDLVGSLNLFEKVRINFFQDFDHSNRKFEVESCKKTTFGEGQVGDSILGLLGHGFRNPAKFLSGK